MAKASTVFYCTECGTESAKWLGKTEIRSVKWLPADEGVVEKLITLL